MTTEILGFIIIVGAIIVIFARRQLQKADDDTEALEASAGKLRFELEQSANEIIDRMAGHIEHLEELLQEAEYKTGLLEDRLDELQQLQLEYKSQPGLDAGDGVARLSEKTGEDYLPEASQEELPVDELADDAEDLYEPAIGPESEPEPEPDIASEPEPKLAQGTMSETQLKALEAIREASMALEAAQNEMGLNTFESEADDGDEQYEAFSEELLEEEGTGPADDEPEYIAALETDGDMELGGPAEDYPEEKPLNIPRGLWEDDYESTQTALQEGLFSEHEGPAYSVEIQSGPSTATYTDSSAPLAEEKYGEDGLDGDYASPEEGVEPVEDMPAEEPMPDEDEVIQRYISREVTALGHGGDEAEVAETLSAEEATIIARKLLEAGFEPEDVGKMTGLGMDAIHLLLQVRG